ncbi:MAG: FimV/HubP family polar landmark protein, partial [Pseudomonadales bacterium]
AGLDPSQIIVGLASAADFERADVERHYFLNSLEFRVERDDRGRQFLKVSTPDVMREPYLNFLLEVRWPNGRMLREYMVLLDLPIYSARNNVQPAEPSSRVAVVRRPTVRTRFEPRSVASTDARLPSTSAGGAATYTVRSNDSLWKIARATMPDTDVNRAMLALQRENPQAFINGNINLLKRGAVLRLPDFDDVDRVSAVAANQAVSAAEKSWRSQNAAAPADLRPIQDASRKVASNDTALPTADGRLTLSSENASVADRLPRRDGAAAAVAGTGRASRAIASIPGSGEISQLQAELAASLENLDRAAMENQSLVERISDVESKFDDLERLLRLKDRELESVRAALEQRQAMLESGELPETSSAFGESTAAVPGVDRTAVPATPEKGLLERLADTFSTSVSGLLMAIAGLGVVLAGLVAWLFARKKDDYTATVFEAPAASYVEDEFEPAAPNASTVAAVDPANDAELQDEFDRQFERSFDGSDDNFAATAKGTADQASTLDEMPEDPIAEADIYLAYGRNDQAVAMLEAAIELEPLRTDLRMKLLEVYDEIGDAAQVEIQKAQILTLDPELGGDIDELLGGASTAIAGSAADTDLDLDLDAGLNKGSTDKPASPPVESDDLEDEVATKLDLARAYIDMGDYDGAREILAEVVEEGSDLQRDEARQMLARFG